MKCPFCKASDDKVIDSRSSNDGFAIRRRRECLSCGRRYTTYERIEELPLRVIKKDGSRVAFERAAITNGMLKALEKRPVSMETVDEVVDRIEAQITQMFDKEVASKFIGELVMRELHALDQIAYVRFASVYREFKDVNEFVDEVKPMLEEKPAQ